MQKLPLINPKNQSISQEELTITLQEIQKRITDELPENDVIWDQLFDVISRKESVSIKSSKKEDSFD